MDSEQSTAASYGDMKPLMNRSKDLGLFHIERLMDYLDNNGGTFYRIGRGDPPASSAGREGTTLRG